MGAAHPRRPRRLRVGWTHWGVEWVDDADWPEEHDDASGLCMTRARDLRVRLQDGTHEDELREALLHELLHACVQTGGAEEPVTSEEAAVRAAAGPLLGALRDNPRLVAWLTG